MIKIDMKDISPSVMACWLKDLKMINDAVGKKCIIDGNALETERLGDVNYSREGAVYEVVRVIDGALLFWDDHMKRMQSSVALLGWSELLIDSKRIKAYIKELLSEAKVRNCNVKIIFYALPDVEKFVIYTPKTQYPEKSVYQNGVSLASLKWKRDNPHAKRFVDSYVETVRELIARENVFEALLVNNDMKVTEGSRSNIFFIKDCVVYTPPKDMVLEGITRKHVLGVCESLDIAVNEDEIDFNDLSEFDAVFLSGTSIHVLPVSKIDEFEYNSVGNPCFNRIIDSFKLMVNDYINTMRD